MSSALRAPKNPAPVEEQHLWPVPESWEPHSRLDESAILAHAGSRFDLLERLVGPGRQLRKQLGASQFWKYAPADLKWLGLTVPLILLVISVSTSGKLPAGDILPATGNVDAAFNDQLTTIKQNILNRAAIEFSDDFRAGLAAWEGVGDWARSWSYDPAGFLRTGPLALYQPTMPLADYRLEFLGQIEKRSIGWAFRAKDHRNYYASKIMLTRPGPLPTAVIEHWAVINGRETAHIQRPLPMQVRADQMWRIRMDVRGSSFTTSVQGKIVDTWSDARLSRGGIGFFSHRGEQARLRWVEVSHQYDMLGRLCALLAPYNLDATASEAIKQ